EVVRINSQSGKGGVLHVLERDFGITLPRWLQIGFSKVVQTEAERAGGEVEGAAIRSLFDATYVSVPEAFRLGNYDVRRTGDRVHLSGDVGGAHLRGEGQGVVLALVDAVKREFALSGRVEAFDEYAIGQGTDASAMACVRLAAGESTAAGVAIAKDT